MTTKNYLISDELLKKVILDLRVYGKSNTKDTITRLENLDIHWVEEEWGGIPDPDSV